MAKAILVVLIILLLAPLSAFSQESNAQTTSSDDWPLFHHDSANTGYSISILSPALTNLWSTPLNSSYISDVVVTNGRVYVNVVLDRGGVFYTLYALDSITGEILWNSTTSSSSLPAQVPSPAVADNIVYTSTSAYNALTGHLLFDYTSFGGSTAPIVADGMVFIGTDANHYFGPGGVVAIDAKTGAKIWNFTGAHGTFPSGFMVYYPPAVANGIVYFSSGGGIYALNAQTGEQLWNYSGIDHSSGSRGCVAVANGKVYANIAGQLRCFDALTGIQTWQYPAIGGGPCPAIANGVVYAGSYALDASTGRVIWNNEISDLSPPTVNGDKVYYSHYRFTNQGGTNSIAHEILAANISNGAILWNLTFPELFSTQIASVPVIANGKLYVTEDYEVCVFGISVSSPTVIPLPTIPEFSVESLWVVLAISSVAITTMIALMRLKRTLHKTSLIQH